MIQYRRAFVLLLLLFPAFVFGLSEVPDDFQQIEKDGFLIAWRIVGTDIEFIVEQSTLGWVAIGFEPSRVMKDADIIIGYVDGSEVVIEDHFAHRLTAHRPDVDMGGSNNVTVISGSEEGGRTRLRFRRPLNTGDEYDTPLSRGQSVEVIFAWGRNRADNTSALHAGHGSVTITL